MTEREWLEPLRLEDGKHKGTITKVEFRTQPYSYVDLFIQPDEAGVEIKYGVPDYLSENSKLGKLLVAFGATAKPKEKVDVETFLVHKRVSFMTLMEKSDKDGEVREFARVVDGSVKPIESSVVTEEKIEDTIGTTKQ